jgi:predicted Zn-dependent protease with MMP-like domain
VTSVGRLPRSDIFLDDVTVSRRHVELRWEKDDFHVTSPGHSAANSVSAATAATNPPRRSRLYLGTDSGTIAQMDARSEPGLNDPFEEAIDDALSSLPADLRAAMSNVEIVVEDEPPDGQPLLGLYRGVTLPQRSSTYSGVLPDKISIFGGPITRLAAGDADRLRREVSHVVLHEIAHHFGISDKRLIELDRY